MDLKYIIVFILILTILSLGVFVAINGISIGNYDILPMKEAIKLGLDLSKGVYVVLEAEDSKEDPVNDEKLSRAIATIRQRVDAFGVAEASVSKQGKSE